jgi:hypothetical protein
VLSTNKIFDSKLCWENTIDWKYLQFWRSSQQLSTILILSTIEKNLTKIPGSKLRYCLLPLAFHARQVMKQISSETYSSRECIFWNFPQFQILVYCQIHCFFRQ